MAGLDKIIGEINAESQRVIDDIINKANSEAQAIKAEAEKSANESCEKLSRDKQIRLSDQLSRAQSAAALAKRQRLLQEKQLIISEVIASAKEKLIALPDSEYFDMVLKLVKKSALPEDGEIIFNQKDKGRLPADFSSKVAAVAKEAGGNLKVSDSTRNIDGGFVLVYKGIEQNSSISALFDTNIEALQDKIQGLLFN
ncbi:MAG: hypothetical protein K6B41_06460 [Butyrivibrio sp.]|nr:hypothetical protein [Butyrivibrio sp.]